MSVYVDDARIPATVGRYNSRWSHLFADYAELHEFAVRLGLRRGWFQDAPRHARPGSPTAESWHYDVTEAKRQAAIRLGARPVTSREGLAILRARTTLTTPENGACS